MAAHSPIILGSSSPDAFRTQPSPSPHDRPRESSIAESSSPGLPSPSVFVKPQKRNSTSSFGAQQFVNGATKGFASAASLLRRGDFEVESVQSRRNNEGLQIHDTSAVKVPSDRAAKRARSKKTQERVLIPRDGSATTLNPPRCALAGDSNTRIADQTPSPDKEMINTIPELPQDTLQKSGENLTSLRNMLGNDSPKQHGKRPTISQNRPSAARRTVPVKHRKKKFTKSESIILNSDDSVSTPADGLREDIKSSVSLIPRPTIGSVLEDTVVEEIAPSLQTAKDNAPELALGSAVNTVNTEESCAFSTLLSSRITQASIPWPPQDLSRPDTDCAKSITPERPTTPASVPSTNSPTPTKSLSALVSGYEFQNEIASYAAHERRTTGEALTKRRRIELVEAPMIGSAPRNKSSLPTNERTKKPQAVKKKPHTITELATKAYRVQTDEAEAQADNLEALKPQKQRSLVLSPRKAIDCDSTKAKRPQNRRKKKENAQAPHSKLKKSKRTKVDESTHMAKLYPPEEARAVEALQGFLFGTSSQLAVEESPDFIQEMQAVLQESEKTHALEDTSSAPTSRVRMSSVPGDKSLSVGQPDRNLWCTAARNHEGDVLQRNWDSCSDVTSKLPETLADLEMETSADVIQSHFYYNELEDPIGGRALTQRFDRDMNTADEPTKVDSDAISQKAVVDLCQSSPVMVSMSPSYRHDVSSRNDCTMNLSRTKDRVSDDFAEAPHMQLDNSSMLPEPADSLRHNFDVPVSPGKSPWNPSLKPSVLKTNPSNTSSHFRRPVLQVLDRNINLLHKPLIVKNANYTCEQSYSTSVLPANTKRPRGRPRKDATTANTEMVPLRGEQRSPNKYPVHVGTAETAQAPKNKRLAFSPSKTASNTKWADINEISDSDSPATPTPPRRRDASSQTPTQPLNFIAAASPLSKAKASAAMASKLKADDTSWPGVAAKLFPQIAAAIKATNPSTDMAKPTWHEKILLYDPIVLEDFTAWLNEQEVRVESVRMKPRAKTKGRKKKNAPPAEPPEYETVREEVKPWMVQKWCEERSVCCLWRDGSNGSRRNRY